METAGLGLQLGEIFDSTESGSSGSELTECQRETLVVAYDRGYFRVPRRTTIVKLADALDVSDQAVSEQLRRVQSTVVRTHVLGSEGPGSEVSTAVEGGSDDDPP